MIASLQSPSRRRRRRRRARRQAQEEARREQLFVDPFGQRAPEEGEGELGDDAFDYRPAERTKLIAPISKCPDGMPSYEDTVADMLRVIAELIDPEDTAATGRFKRANRDTL